MRKDSSGGTYKFNKYRKLKPSEQKNTSGQRRVRREQLTREEEDRRAQEALEENERQRWEENERQRGDDDGREYGDPRDHMAGIE